MFILHATICLILQLIRLKVDQLVLSVNYMLVRFMQHLASNHTRWIEGASVELGIFLHNCDDLASGGGFRVFPRYLGSPCLFLSYLAIHQMECKRTRQKKQLC